MKSSNYPLTNWPNWVNGSFDNFIRHSTWDVSEAYSTFSQGPGLTPDESPPGLTAASRPGPHSYGPPGLCISRPACRLRLHPTGVVVGWLRMGMTIAEKILAKKSRLSSV